MTLTAVLFVGGESRRMGVDKATLLVAGEPLWTRQLRILCELKPESILISARVRPAWCPPEMEVVLDEPPSRGPLSGLAAALKKIQTTHLLTLAIDLPRMEAGHLRKLLKRSHANGGVVPSLAGKLQPLCAVYPGGNFALAAAERSLSPGDCSMQSFVSLLTTQKRLEIFSVPDWESDHYLNMNTAEQFAAAVRLGRV